MNLPTTCDVLVVGAGPTGLMLAGQLARRGVRCVIIDRHAGPSLQTRALVVHARTLEIYARMGIAERAVDWGKRATGANMWVGGRHSARAPLGDIGKDLSPFPYLLILGQDDNERLLGDFLREQNVPIHWNTELIALEQQADRVRASCKLPDGTTTTLEASWVAGCDGARSAVRSLNNIDFPGAPYEHVFFVADTHLTGNIVPNELNVYLWHGGFHLFFPMRGTDHWRIVGIVPAHQRERDNLTFAELIPAIRHQINAANLQFHECFWFSTYRIHHRRAVRFHDRRCFLLGDAAHIHSPVGGQGMNTGLQDAYNLAWKLALVVRNHTADTLLDTYAAEREPVAEQLLKTTDRMFTFVISERWTGSFFRMHVLSKIIALAMRVQRMRTLMFRTISQIGVRYPRSPLSKSTALLPKGAPLAGDRFPWLKVQFANHGPVEDLFQQLDDCHFTLLLFGQAAPESLPLILRERMNCLIIPVTFENGLECLRKNIPSPSYFLLRPDGHVGLAGTHLEVRALDHYFRNTLYCI